MPRNRELLPEINKQENHGTCRENRGTCCRNRELSPEINNQVLENGLLLSTKIKVTYEINRCFIIIILI